MVTKMSSVQLDGALLTPKEAAAYLQIHLNALQNMRSRGQGPPWIKPGGKRVYYPQRLFEEWLSKSLIVPNRERVA